MAEKNIIILKRTPGDRLVFQYALWADVPAARQEKYANANFESAYVDVTAGQLTALRNGSVVEKVEKSSADPGTTVATMKQRLEVRWQQYQDYITAYNAWSSYGTYWNGSTWIQQGVS